MAKKAKLKTATEFTDLADYLELERLEIIEKIDVVEEGYTTTDLERIAVYGAAINSIRDAAKFKLKTDGQ